MRITFLTPGAGLVALAVILPLIAFARTERRVERVRSLLRLSAPGGSPRLTVAALVALALLVGLAAAQPVLEEWDERPERVDAQVFLAFDTTRSMLASRGPGEPTRFERATAAAEQLREALGDVPIGIASLTDRVLPLLFPTSNRASFDQVLQHSIAVDKPASDLANNRLATDLGGARFFATSNYFRSSQRRVLVILTDAETKRYDIGQLTAAFAGSNVNTILMRFWAENERVYGEDGNAEEYIPSAGSAESAERFAQQVRGETFDESEVAPMIESVRSKLGSGTSIARVKTVDIQPLGPFILLVALLPLGYLLVRRNLSPV
jgi:von Willebrand factor type A domain